MSLKVKPCALNKDLIGRMQQTEIKAVKIGTRGSPLALYQARLVQSLLMKQTGQPIEIFPIQILKTSGDQIKGELKDFGGKGLFTKELEEALLDGRIDVAVHSMKDVPTVGHQALNIMAILERADVRDAFISKEHQTLEGLPKGALIGSASIRRRAQLSAMRPDLKFCLLRGNVGTRLKKLAAGECDATLLACAGLRRLGQDSDITQAVDVDVMLPAPAQGAIGVEGRKGDTRVQELTVSLNDRQTDLAITAERAFLRALDGSCRTPIAALATLEGDRISLRGQVLSKDGQLVWNDSQSQIVNSRPQADQFGFEMGQAMRAKIGDRVIWDE